MFDIIDALISQVALQLLLRKCPLDSRRYFGIRSGAPVLVDNDLAAPPYI